LRHHGVCDKAELLHLNHCGATLSLSRKKPHPIHSPTMDFWNRPTKHRQIREPAAKRISTPAGQRLSIILENGLDTKTREAHRLSVKKSGLPSAVADGPPESEKGSGYSTSVWSDGEKFQALKNHRQIAKRGGWKRVLIILSIILLLIIVLAVGLAVGLKKKGSQRYVWLNIATSHARILILNSSSSTTTPTDTSKNGSPNPVSNPIAPPNANPTAPSSTSPSSAPANFPLGSYSLVTFLDTVQTNCTSNPDTWTCYPYTEYNTSPSKAIATFNWIISGTAGSYKISSTDNPFAITFTNTALTLLDAGKETERYHFQLNLARSVSPSSNITTDNSAVECQFPGTSLQASLYTRMSKSYPNAEKGDPTGDPISTPWPYAVRIEQVAGGGQNVPECYKSDKNGKVQMQGGPVGDFEPQDRGALCSCLYKNWRTPSPY
jgi:hypothetical protein